MKSCTTSRSSIEGTWNEPWQLKTTNWPQLISTEWTENNEKNAELSDLLVWIPMRIPNNIEATASWINLSHYHSFFLYFSLHQQQSQYAQVNLCKHCRSVNLHFNFVCTFVRLCFIFRLQFSCFFRWSWTEFSAFFSLRLNFVWANIKSNWKKKSRDGWLFAAWIWHKMQSMKIRRDDENKMKISSLEYEYNICFVVRHFNILPSPVSSSIASIECVEFIFRRRRTFSHFLHFISSSLHHSRKRCWFVFVGIRFSFFLSRALHFFSYFPNNGFTWRLTTTTSSIWATRTRSDEE